MKLITFQHYLQEQNFDLVFMVHPDPAITYFSQMKPSHAIFVITPSLASLYLSKLDKTPSIKRIIVKELKKDWEQELANSAVKKVGINKEQLTVTYLEKLERLYPHAAFSSIAETLQQLRAQKTPQEIEKVTKACSITSKAFQELIVELSHHTLKTEQDVALFLEKSIRQQGGDLAFPTIVAMGKNAATPHHVTSTTKLTKGFLLCDFGAQFQHYCADMTRVVYLGKPSPKEQELYNLLLQAQQTAINAVARSLPFPKLDAIARKRLGKYAPYFIHSLGHGVGIEIHEAPSFLANNTIQENHIFTIEPGIYFPGKLGLRIEDTLLFNGKVRILTTAPKELLSLPF